MKKILLVTFIAISYISCKNDVTQVQKIENQDSIQKIEFLNPLIQKPKIVVKKQIGTTKTKYYWAGYDLYEYSNPLQLPNGKYRAWATLTNQSNEPGKLLIDEPDSKFTLSLPDGTNMTASILKKTKEKKMVVYEGEWIEDRAKCELAIGIDTIYGKQQIASTLRMDYFYNRPLS